MTLLLAARGQDHLVVLSDGLSLSLTNGEWSVGQTDLQKQFAIEGLPILVAHHGVNRLGSLPVEHVLTSKPFQNRLRSAWPSGLNQVLGKSLLELDSAVTQTLESVPDRREFGLWFAGLWTCTDQPDIAELMWQNRRPTQTRVRCHPLDDLSFGGSGVKFLKDLLEKGFNETSEIKPPDNKRPESSMEFLKSLYRKAFERQKEAGEQLFGGQTMMSLITPDGVDLGPVDIVG